ncbi:hypothetical protein P154DRAFT_454672 [Amniculicola lignicola CBS 123094]|uniref:Uncharacterized protein n=1 Tax=Amniculicola lignicola CBS 123094 TaxID=1392246 RepID=A0A6A5WYR4_9PLEO|nr:hypothetical protein P154DRAFT_454672 [Amniculicola lignicola CBS 123094]
MGVLSILPENFSVLEAWVTRLFLLFAAIVIGPWAALLFYDFILYVVRAVGHEIPYFGGRARGRARPRAPSLTERPSGHRRRFSLARRPEGSPYPANSLKAEASDSRRRHIKEEVIDDSSST